jgi:hypothetical protein
MASLFHLILVALELYRGQYLSAQQGLSVPLVHGALLESITEPLRHQMLGMKREMRLLLLPPVPPDQVLVLVLKPPVLLLQANLLHPWHDLELEVLLLLEEATAV